MFEPPGPAIDLTEAALFAACKENALLNFVRRSAALWRRRKGLCCRHAPSCPVIPSARDSARRAPGAPACGDAAGYRRIERSRTGQRSSLRRRRPLHPQIAAPPNPYVDYGRTLTPEGGILIVYKDHDVRLRHFLWLLFAWGTFTGGETWCLVNYSLLHSDKLTAACLFGVATVNFLIVARPVELYRSIEVRPDCVIVEGTDIFWRHYMDVEWPTLRLWQ